MAHVQLSSIQYIVLDHISKTRSSLCFYINSVEGVFHPSIHPPLSLGQQNLHTSVSLRLLIVRCHFQKPFLNLQDLLLTRVSVNYRRNSNEETQTNYCQDLCQHMILVHFNKLLQSCKNVFLTIFAKCNYFSHSALLCFTA